MNILTSAAAFLVAIGILVAVHEYGHFVVARLLGVRVLRFSIGFGRPVWMWRSGRDRTEYCISAIPFGGYVKLLDERDCPVTLAEQPRAFNRQPIPSRVTILAAGPMLNFLFAIAAYWCVFMIGVPGTRPLIGEITPDSAAAHAGLRDGDEIVGVGARTTPTLEGVVAAMLDELLSSGRIDLRVRREGGTESTLTLDAVGRAAELTEPGQLFVGLGFRPWIPELPPVLGDIVAGESAERSGLETGDRIIAADGKPIADWQSWVGFVRKRPGEIIAISVERGGRTVDLQLSIGREETPDGVIGHIGAGPPHVSEEFFKGMITVERYPPGAAFAAALERSWEMGSLTLRMVMRMISGDVSVKNISGPINIAQYAGYSASVGLSPFLGFLAIVSISLGILNLLPVPMLDGGQIAYQLVEAVKGSPLSERAQLIGQQVGIAVLLLLMTFAVYNDLSRLLG